MTEAVVHLSCREHLIEGSIGDEGFRLGYWLSDAVVRSVEHCKVEG